MSSDGSGSIISGSGAGGEYIFLSTGSTGAIVFSLTTAGTLTDPQGFMYSADSTGIDTVLRSPSNQRGFDLLQCQATASQQLNCFVGSCSQNIFALLGGTLGLQTSKYNSDYPPVCIGFASPFVGTNNADTCLTPRSRSRLYQHAKSRALPGGATHGTQ